MRRLSLPMTICIAIALLTAPLSAPAAATPYAAPDVSVTVDGLGVSFEVPPQRENYSVLVPFRAISEAIGVTVEWVAAERGIIATRPAAADSPAVEVRLWIDRPTAMVNGVEQQLTALPRLVSDKTFIPARFFATAFGCGVDWNEAAQRVLITTGERTMTVYGFYALGSDKTSSWTDLFGMPYPDIALATAHQRLLSGVGFGWYSIDAQGHLSDDGAIAGWSRPGGSENALLRADQAGLTGEMVIHANGSESKLASLLGNQQVLAGLRTAIVAAAASYDGVNLDWESFTTGLDAAGKVAVRDSYAAFVTALAADLHAAGKTLTVTVQPGNGAFAAGFDYAALGAAADRLVLMAYDYYDHTQPSPLAPLAKVEEAIKLLLAQRVPADKVLLGLAPGGAEWVTKPTAGVANRLANGDVASYKAAHAVTWDATAQANWLSYQDAAGQTIKVWIEDGQSISLKIALAKRYGLRGIAVWRLGDIPGDVWTAIDDATKPERATSAQPQTQQP